MQIEKNYKVEYAHRLVGHKGNCRYLHGHSGRVRIVFKGKKEELSGMVCDFGKFGWLAKILEEYDHALVLQKSDTLLEYLLKGIEDDKIDPLRLVIIDGPPTAENICERIATAIDVALSKYTRKMGSLFLYSVTFEETEGNAVIHHPLWPELREVKVEKV